VDNAEAQFLGHDFCRNRIPESSIVQQIWSDHDKGPSGTQRAGGLGKSFAGLIEVLDDHATSDQIEAVISEGQVVQRTSDERPGIAVGRHRKIHAED